MRTVLVTGDRGYIGSALIPLLLKHEYKVIGFDTDYFSNGKKNISSPNYKSIIKDIRRVERKDLEDIEAIIHLSALSNDPMGEIDPRLTQEINFKSSVKLAKLAKKNRIKRFLFSSSCSIYGIAKDGVVDESSRVNALTAYAKSKIDTEHELFKLADSSFCVGIMRNATVYGYSPRFRDDLMVNNLVTSALGLGKIKVLSDGTPWRPLIDVRDLARAFIAFLEAPKEKINGEVINVGFTSSNYRVKDIVSMIKKELPTCDIEYTHEHGSDARSYRVKFDKFNRLFPDFKQEWPLEKSIQDLIIQLRKIRYGKKDFLTKKYTRLNILRKLIGSEKLDNRLFYTK